MTDLLELATRCEQASGHDMQLDRAISEALDIWWILETDCPGPWTASLDAAMTLVPKHLDWNVGWHTLSLSERTARANIYDGSSPLRIYVDARTPALALCAAALRARNSTHG